MVARRQSVCRAVSARHDLLWDGAAQHLARLVFRSKVACGPVARLCRLLGQREEGFGIARKEPSQGRRGGRREAAMRGWIAWVVGWRKERLELGIELGGSDLPIGILGVPTCDCRIV